MSKDVKLEKMKLDEIVPYVNNQKKHSTEQVEKIMGSIKEFGIVNPLIIDKENVLIAGHGRYEALKRLRYDEVAVIRAEHLTPAQVKAYRIVDNRIAEFGEWDDELLKIELQEIENSNLGFNINELEFDYLFIDEEESENINEEPRVKLTNELYEENNYIVLKFENTIDWINLLTLYPLETVKGKSKRETKGVGRVVDGVDFLNKILGKQDED